MCLFYSIWYSNVSFISQFVTHIQSKTITTRNTHLGTNITVYLFFCRSFSCTDKNQIHYRCFFSQNFNFKEQNSHNDHNGQDPIFQIPNHKIKQNKMSNISPIIWISNRNNQNIKSINSIILYNLKEQKLAKKKNIYIIKKKEKKVERNEPRGCSNLKELFAMMMIMLQTN